MPEITIETDIKKWLDWIDETNAQRAVAACAAIAGLLDGKTWSPDTLEDIASILREAGYEIAEPREEDEPPDGGKAAAELMLRDGR